jgi:hypothetical protein
LGELAVNQALDNVELKQPVSEPVSGMK